MAGAVATQRKLVEEIKGRIKQEDASVPYRDNGYYYYSRYATGSEYPIYCRKKGSTTAPEEVLLDANKMGAGKSYFQIGDWAVSDNNQLLAYSTDTVSRRLYTLQFKNMATGKRLPERIANTGGEVVWAADNKTVFYTKKDVTTLLPYQVYRHTLGTDPKTDALVYEEKDNTFNVHLDRSKSRQYIGINLVARCLRSTATWRPMRLPGRSRCSCRARKTTCTRWNTWATSSTSAPTGRSPITA